MNLSDCNTMLIGTIKNEKKFSHQIYDEKFFTFELEVKRLSGKNDIIPITISEILVDNRFSIGVEVLIKGQFRSYNTVGNKLLLTVFVKDIYYDEEIKKQLVEDKKQIANNEIVLTGHICKSPNYRKTPLGKEISDLLIAVNRSYNKSDYIPTIAWGRIARLCKNLAVGTEVKIIGRVQSREYEKKYEDDKIEIKTAYEISVMSLQVKELEQVV